MVQCQVSGWNGHLPQVSQARLLHHDDLQSKLARNPAGIRQGGESREPTRFGCQSVQAQEGSVDEGPDPWSAPWESNCPHECH